MMREVIAEALSVARSVNRTISLSYDMGDWTVTEYRANELKGRINKALSQIIRQSMTNDRVGHIDINLAGEQLHIIAGTTALRIAIDPAKAPAINGQDALDKCDVEMPHAILVDWAMPVMDGFDFVKHLRQMPDGDKPTVVFCTAVRDVERIVEALAAGADEYIMKPFDSDIIESKFALAGLV